MKQKLGLAAVLLAAGILAAGCGGSSTAEESSVQSAETTTSAAETTTAPADTTTAQTTTASAAQQAQETDTAPAEQTECTGQGSTAAPPDSTENTGLMQSLIARLSETTDAVSVRYKMEVEGEMLEGKQVTYGECFYSMASSPRYCVTVCSDGTKIWMLHDATKAYAVMTGSSANNLKPKSLVPDADAMGTVIGSGSEAFKGKVYRYEDFDEPAEDGELERNAVRFYFDEQGNLIGYKGLEGDDAGVEAEFEIKAVKSPDMAQFSPPADYTEVDEQTLTEHVYAAMFAAETE